MLRARTDVDAPVVDILRDILRRLLVPLPARPHASQGVLLHLVRQVLGLVPHLVHPGRGRPFALFRRDHERVRVGPRNLVVREIRRVAVAIIGNAPAARRRARHWSEQVVDVAFSIPASRRLERHPRARGRAVLADRAGAAEGPRARLPEVRAGPANGRAFGAMRRKHTVGARPAREVARARASEVAAAHAAVEGRRAPERFEDAVVVVLEVPARAVVHHVQIAIARHGDKEEREHQREAEQDGHRLLRRPRSTRDRHGVTRAGTAKGAT